MHDLLGVSAEGWETIGVTFANGGLFLHNNGIAYLDYDGSLTINPVNQIPYTNHFFERISTFAHDLDDAMGHWTLQSATEEDRMAAYNTIRDMIAFAADKFDEFAAIDPLERIIGGNNDGRLLWKHGLPEALEVFEQVCGNCDRKTLLRQVVMNANLPLLRRLYRSGIIYSIDFDLDPLGRANLRSGDGPAQSVLRRPDCPVHPVDSLLRHGSGRACGARVARIGG